MGTSAQFPKGLTRIVDLPSQSRQNFVKTITGGVNPVFRQLKVSPLVTISWHEVGEPRGEALGFRPWGLLRGRIHLLLRHALDWNRGMVSFSCER